MGNSGKGLVGWFLLGFFLMIFGGNYEVNGAKLATAMFNFGDSLTDCGNNNNLASLAKSNYVPYGIDFFMGPTGRFCNGRTIADFLGELLGLPYIPPFEDPNTKDRNLLSGVNYASAAAGILDETGYQLALHSLGLRKFVLAGVGPLGCIPNQLATGLAPIGSCVTYVNEIVGSFNIGLRDLVTQLNANHPNATFIYGNVYGALGDILHNPSTYGFKVANRGCCGLGRNEGQITCLPLATPCPNRNEYVFWDAFHPTEAVNNILAHRAFTGPPSVCYPINVQELAMR
ncbi:GDSL esterase/lipase At1g71250 isoform X2 [Amborella trichopoda]|uniref:GDSL esterase/lipase At1g71250 isoform X2 n=1 Tax=Amborella trichopoda TaxID=13333 RepID=UPI0009BF2147|nr:GDSL esterase/lipase At1g71250 isoform X2 [Amborella trichopoda]|eukprot:XP_020519008.1 GDSL esterase/lipase At1g71250 isoform X2 [Amborella trichopoda]